MRITFVCSGNICRSPYAEARLRRYILEEGWADVEVASGGTLGLHGMPAHPLTIALAGEQGLSILDHRSQSMTESAIANSDLVFGMAREHVIRLRDSFPAHRDRIYLLGAFPRHDLEGEEVADPIGESEEAFREVYAHIDRLIGGILAELRRMLGVKDLGNRPL